MMKRLTTTIIIFSLMSMIFISCYYDSKEALYPELNTSCDTLNVTYSGTIVNILSNNCYSCHSNKNAASLGGNIKLENYADVAGSATRISGSISHKSSFIPMPKNGGSIKNCSIKQFNIWVQGGMVNN